VVDGFELIMFEKLRFLENICIRNSLLGVKVLLGICIYFFFLYPEPFIRGLITVTDPDTLRKDN
jgi:hypothetical protein